MRVVVKYWYKKGIALLKAELPDRALECFDRALEKEPEDTDILLKKGIALFLMEKPEQAIEIFDQILGEEPENYQALNNKGMALLSLEKTDDAMEHLENAAAESDTRGWADLNISILKRMNH